MAGFMKDGLEGKESACKVRGKEGGNSDSLFTTTTKEEGEK